MGDTKIRRVNCLYSSNYARCKNWSRVCKIKIERSMRKAIWGGTTVTRSLSLEDRGKGKYMSAQLVSSEKKQRLLIRDLIIRKARTVREMQQIT